MQNNIKFLFAGDTSLVIEFGNEISVDINKQIRRLKDNLNNAKDKWDYWSGSDILFFTYNLWSFNHFIWGFENQK